MNKLKLSPLETGHLTISLWHRRGEYVTAKFCVTEGDGQDLADAIDDPLNYQVEIKVKKIKTDSLAKTGE